MLLQTLNATFKGGIIKGIQVQDGLNGKNGWNEGKRDADKKKNPAKTDKRMETVDCEIREHVDRVDCSRLARLYLSPEAGCCYCSYRPLAVGGSGRSRVQESMRGFGNLTKRKWGGVIRV